jgi:hypothetical protein
MDLETALSRAAQFDRCEGILRGVLLDRRAELRKYWRSIVASECLRALGSLAKEVETFLSGPDTFRDWRFTAGCTWMYCEPPFLDYHSAIALAGEVEYQPSTTSPPRLFPADLNKLSRNERFEALCARYRCPLNIGLASEFDIAEELLRQLMVRDRAKLEAGAEFDVEMVLLKLNLVGIRAMISRDLRYLDALNYFYELPRRSLKRMRAHPRFLAFWLCIYAQLLCTPDWQKCALQ